MIPELRRQFNEEQFDPATHQALIDWIEQQYNHRPPFAIAETPIFVPASLHAHLLRACDDIIEVIVRPDFMERSEGALLPDQRVPNESAHTHFLQLDFGIVLDEAGQPYPMLIEAQGFPSLYFYQDTLARAYRQFYELPEEMSSRFGGLSHADYIKQLRDIIIGDHHPENVVLLEVQPHQQATRVDFYAAQRELGILPICISEVEREGRRLYYQREGRRTPIERIYNRVIFDELTQRQDLDLQFTMTEEIDASWAGHPNWFFRISKHTLPLFDTPYVPRTYFASDPAVAQLPLQDYVLKPLYSFAGAGVNLDPTAADLAALTEPEHFVLQQKVTYAPVIETPDGGAKVEIRMMFLWPDGASRPQLVNNLVRMSKGRMTGVRFNKGKTWVGGTVGFFEPLHT